jgi:hypothetical protein
MSSRPLPQSHSSTPIFGLDPLDKPITDEPEKIDASIPDAGVRRYSETTATHKGRNGSLHLSIPANPPTAFRTPPRVPQSPIRSARSSSADLGVLREVDENDDNKGRMRLIKSEHTTKPSSCPKSVWLCSKPPLSPPGSPTALAHARRKSETRPLVVRAMSTGRLGSETDDEGRVLCLSNHCERVLKARASMSPAPSPTKDCHHLARSVSNQDRLQPKRQVLRSRTSELFPIMSSDKEVRKQSSWRRGDDSRRWKELSA